jgi:membrane protein
MRLRDFLSMLGSAFTAWREHNALRLSAALAYYALFSLAPLLILGIAIAGFVFGEQAARGQAAEQMKQFAGGRAAAAIQTLALGIPRKTTSVSATVVGLVVMLFGASGVFMELKDALNTVWGVAIKPGSPLLALIRERIISFTMVLCAGFLLLFSLILSAVLAALGPYLHGLSILPVPVWQGADILFSFAVVTLLFAAVFKMLPNVRTHWRDVWIGAAITSFLFTTGKFLIGFYLGRSGVASYYGAAGSAIIILLWVYYSACILFFGAEFTKVYVLKRHGKILPDKRAVLRSNAPGN